MQLIYYPFARHYFISLKFSTKPALILLTGLTGPSMVWYALRRQNFNKTWRYIQEIFLKAKTYKSMMPFAGSCPLVRHCLIVKFRRHIRTTCSFQHIKKKSCQESFSRMIPVHFWELVHTFGEKNLKIL